MAIPKAAILLASAGLLAAAWPAPAEPLPPKVRYSFEQIKLENGAGNYAVLRVVTDSLNGVACYHMDGGMNTTCLELPRHRP